ncbi:hypothetical protein D9Q98_008225 [Chlorella vulgaris]|uniref:Uncharacterized protein n=1 Tax=Chlorella vulgaris TaxID=3077 RepID=A0A9D4YT73_CHLVU|nr:hypothetical protein D9Q98_008225 [Chlorella vulgaris]
MDSASASRADTCEVTAILVLLVCRWHSTGHLGPEAGGEADSRRRHRQRQRVGGISAGVDIKVDECVLVIGKVATLQGIKHIIELHKLVNLSCNTGAASQGMLHWNLEALELHRLLACAEAGPAAAAAAQASAPARQHT